ncbi:MAG: hypothetical protein AB7U76_24475 [Pirellulales bacterium]
MAALTLQAAITPSRQVTVTYSTDDAIGAATVALVIDNTANPMDVSKCIKALVRSYNRQKAKNSKVSTIPTTGTTRE